MSELQNFVIGELSVLRWRSCDYKEYRFWSAILGCDAARLSLAGGKEAAAIHGEPARHQEWHAVVSAEGSGRLYRERREKTLDAIEDAIMRGDPPGEVLIT